MLDVFFLKFATNSSKTITFLHRKTKVVENCFIIPPPPPHLIDNRGCASVNQSIDKTDHIIEYLIKKKTAEYFIVFRNSCRIIYCFIAFINCKVHRIAQDASAYFSVVFSLSTHYKLPITHSSSLISLSHYKS
jgi:hypothetical protein